MKYRMKKDAESGLYRIICVTPFNGIDKGAIGGLVSGKHNLSQKGDCWISYNAKVIRDAEVKCDAYIDGRAVITDQATIAGNALIDGAAKISDHAIVTGNALVRGSARVGNSVTIEGNACVQGNAVIMGMAYVSCRASISSNALISTTSDYLCVGPIGSRRSHTTFYKTRGGGISVVCGCRNATIDKFEDIVKEVYGNTYFGKHYKGTIKLAKLVLRSE